MERMQSVAERWREHGFDLDFGRTSSISATATRPRPTSTEHGWQMTGSTINELLTPTDFRRSTSDTPFADLRYVSGTLGGER